MNNNSGFINAGVIGAVAFCIFAVGIIVSFTQAESSAPNVADSETPTEVPSPSKTNQLAIVSPTQDNDPQPTDEDQAIDSTTMKPSPEPTGLTLENPNSQTLNTASLTLGGEWDIALEYPSGWKIDNSSKVSTSDGVTQQTTIVQIDPETNDFEDGQEGVIYMEIIYSENDERLSESYYQNQTNATRHPTEPTIGEGYCYNLGTEIECVIQRPTYDPFLIRLNDTNYLDEFNAVITSLNQS